ncbi:MAG: hypothetical protein KAR21_02825 [Spirochaetales bacterium]|nr:hypothetical protein [Spirochaetales bacterium]
MNKMFKRISLVILVFFLYLPLSAVEIQGIIFADYYGDVEPSTPYENIRSRFYFQPAMSGSLFNYAVDFVISANLFYDPVYDPSLIVSENILKEAWLFIPFENFDLSFGQKIVSPGMVDVFSPLNIVNSEHAYKLSLDDPYDGRRADLLAQIVYYPNFDDSIELIYVPFPRPDYEPTNPVNMIYQYIDIDILFNSDPYMIDNGHSFFLAYNHISTGFDLQVNYACYIDQTPNFDLTDLTNAGTLTGDAESIYSRNHTFGGSYSTSFGGITLVEELAVNLTEDPDGTRPGIKNSDITFNSQITGTLPGGTFAQMNIIYQYVINFNKNGTVYSDNIDKFLIDEFNTYFNQPVQNIAFVIAHLHNSFFHDRLYVALNGGYFHPVIYLAPRIAFAISDGMKIETGADIKTGEPSDKFLARGNLMDNYFVRLKYEY